MSWSSACSAWPNSWNNVVASSSEISTGSPGAPLTKLLLFDVIAVDAAVEPVLRPVAGGPRARTLAGAREVVEVEESPMGAGGASRHFEHADVGMEHRHLAGDLREA